MTGDPLLVWALFAPLIAATVAVLFQQTWPGKRRYHKLEGWLRVMSLVAATGGLCAQAVLLCLANGTASLHVLAIGLAISPQVRVALIASEAAFFCLLLVSWRARVADGYRGVFALSTLLGTMIAASLLAMCLLVTDWLITVFCLFGAAMCVTVMSTPMLSGSLIDKQESSALQHMARRIAGGAKHLVMASIGTCLLVAGGLLVARYPFNLENIPGTANWAGVALGWIGGARGQPTLRSSSSGPAKSAPQAAIVMLGATVPAVLVAGSHAFAVQQSFLPEVSQTGRQAALGLAAVGALLAGLRALGATTLQPDRTNSPYALLAASSITLQIAWALFGVLSANHYGEVGATLLAANLALAVPLVAIGQASAGKAVGAASLLGLPPFGGFIGTLLIAQAAIEVNGIWLALLLVGSALVAAGWMRFAGQAAYANDDNSAEDGRFAPNAPLSLLTWVLVLAQIGFAGASLLLAGIL